MEALKVGLDGEEGRKLRENKRIKNNPVLGKLEKQKKKSGDPSLTKHIQKYG
jgi:hypothetical protein